MNVYASLENLRAVNDNYDSKFFFENVTTAFKKYDNFENIFNEVRVLCLSKSLNKKCFSIFCKPVQGASSAAHSVKGICLEFEYNKQSGITSNDVKYVSQKELNAVRSIPLYIIKKERSFKLKKIFKKKEKLNQNELKLVLEWSRGGTHTTILDSWIMDLVFTKLRTDYKFEKEFRFVHVSPEKLKSSQVQYLNTNCDMSFSSIGLNLVKIHTTDKNEVYEYVKSINKNYAVIEWIA